MKRIDRLFVNRARRKRPKYWKNFRNLSRPSVLSRNFKKVSIINGFSLLNI